MLNHGKIPPVKFYEGKMDRKKHVEENIWDLELYKKF